MSGGINWSEIAAEPATPDRPRSSGPTSGAPELQLRHAEENAAAAGRAAATSYPGMKAAPRFRESVLAQLIAPENVADLERLVRQARKAAGLPQDRAVGEVGAAVREFARGAGRDAASFDPLALRARVSGGAAFWPEVRRLNAMFLDGPARDLGGGTAPPPSDDPADPYVDAPDISRRIFEKTVLRPPGREHLNGPGPLWQQREYQSAWGSGHDGGAARRHETTPTSARAAYSGMSPNNPYRVAPTSRGHFDAALRGKTLLTPSYEETGARGAPYEPDDSGDPGDRLLGDVSAWGDAWHRSGSEFDRWRGVPVWQRGGRRPHDEDDVEGTLGLGDREAGGIFRRYDMSRMRSDSVYRVGGPMLAGGSGPAVGTTGTRGSGAADVAIGTVPPGLRVPAVKLPVTAAGARHGHPV
jgi:hypothetical protein